MTSASEAPRPPKVALLGLYHEANTFASRRAELSAFKSGSGLVEGPEIRRRFAGTASTLGGFLGAADSHGFDLVPLAFARVNPTGPITDAAMRFLCDRFGAHLREAGPWDAVLLAMHGAGVSEIDPDADGLVTRLVRDVVGPNVAVGAVLDMHANPSQRLVDSVDVIRAYQTNPHLDGHLQAAAVAGSVHRLLDGRPRSVIKLLRLPLAANILCQNTAEDPMESLLADAEVLVQGNDRVTSLQIVEGYPYADVPTMGMAVLATAADQEAANDATQVLASRIWACREQLDATASTPLDALARVRDSDQQESFVLLDVGDNIGAGGPGDSTELLHVAADLQVPVLATLHDPEAVERCWTTGSSNSLASEVGGRQADSPSPPLKVRGTVVYLGTGKFVEPKPTHGGFQTFDAGRTATIHTDTGSTIVLTTKLVANTSLEQYRSAGIEPRDHRVIVAKGVNAPRAAYADLGATFVPVATAGVTQADFRRFPYKHRPVPMYPFEDNLHDWAACSTHEETR